MDKLSQNWLTVSPAYGRDYKSAVSAADDFLRGKDFVMESVGVSGERYCSLRDFTEGTKVCVRYAKLAKVTVVTVPQTCAICDWPLDKNGECPFCGGSPPKDK